jgi:hypothetical protein
VSERVNVACDPDLVQSPMFGIFDLDVCNETATNTGTTDYYMAPPPVVRLAKSPAIPPGLRPVMLTPVGESMCPTVLLVRW